MGHRNAFLQPLMKLVEVIRVWRHRRRSTIADLAVKLERPVEVNDAPVVRTAC
jgi:hypothetical protein